MYGHPCLKFGFTQSKIHMSLPTTNVLQFFLKNDIQIVSGISSNSIKIYKSSSNFKGTIDPFLLKGNFQKYRMHG